MIACQEVNERLLDVYCGEVAEKLRVQVVEHLGVCQTCAAEWHGMERIAQMTRASSVLSPSQLSINKILAYANARAEELEGRAFWRFLWQPRLALALIVALAVFGTHDYWRGLVPGAGDIAVNNVANDDVLAPSRVISQHLFHTPLDDMSPGMGLSTATSGRVSYVSTGPTRMFGSQHFAFDDGLDQKMLLGPMNDSDLEALFYRARKMEKLGEYREALNDYEFISKFHPDFNNIKAVNFSMARCLQELGYHEMATALLKQLKVEDPENEDIDFWLDQLKSETL
jgi:hypothetical protein